MRMMFEGRSVPVVGRSGWGARHPKTTPTKVDWSFRTSFIVHHSGGTASQSVRSIQDWCMDGRKFSDIDYNMLVGQGGTVFTGRGLNIRGAHAVGHNTVGVGVCVIGTNQLSGAARVALRYLYTVACREAGRRLLVQGHSAVDSTACPGDRIRDWLRHGWLDPRELRHQANDMMRGGDVRDVQELVRAEPDGWYGPATAAEVAAWQREHHLRPDGIVGPLTRGAMML